MSMLYTKTKFKINTNNGELLETVLERIKEIKRGGWGGDIIKTRGLTTFFFPAQQPSPTARPKIKKNTADKTRIRPHRLITTSWDQDLRFNELTTRFIWLSVIAAGD